ncbi:GNAT family N-acetyltransferase [Leptolyngbya ohadii]|uniref:GNAT family N-acetyltransferase n=1 Tax=Leptolyngbya ohadii TaxID=1962290 RepID=UPI000B5987D8|nr:GNAT family N-acetyltransferase [Leptolyngbya ohadii]
MKCLRTRKASPSDFGFVYRLHCQVFFSYVDQTWGWQEDQQRRGMREDFEDFPFQIICNGDRDIGAVSALDRGSEIQLKYLAILPEYQRCGFGTQLLTEVLAQASDRQLPVKLTVMRVNPAKALYERLGFAIVQEEEGCVQMVKFPEAL